MIDIDVGKELDDKTLQDVEELRDVRQAIKALKAQEGELRKRILEVLEGSNMGVTASGVPLVEVDRQTRTRLNTKKLQALYQDAWADCQTETVVETVRLPETI